MASLRSVGDPLDGRYYVANVPTCGPFLILSPALKVDPQGSSDYVPPPPLEALGTP